MTIAKMIKPFKWEKVSEFEIVAETGVRRYVIEDFDEYALWFWDLEDEDGWTVASNALEAGSVEEAKAAAWNDWLSLIRSVMVEDPMKPFIKMAKASILRCLTEDIEYGKRKDGQPLKRPKKSQAIFNKREGYQIFNDTDLEMVMDKVVLGLFFLNDELKR